MGQVITSASMSLDGYIAKDDNTIGRLFDWLQNGEVEIPTVRRTSPPPEPGRAPSTGDSWVAGLGALVCGRTLFDFTDGWGGRHTMDVPVVVVTHEVPTDWVEAHPDAPFHFVTDGVEAAVAKAQDIAGDAHRGGDGRHHRAAVPRARACSTRSPSTWCPWSWAGPSLLRGAVARGHSAWGPDGLHPG